MASTSFFDKALAERAVFAMEEILCTDFQFAIKAGKLRPSHVAKELDQDFYYIGILSKIEEPINAYALMIIDMSSADEMMGILTNDHIFNFDEFKQSAMQELGNIVIGSFASGLGKKLGVRIDYTIPLVAVDQPNALVDALTAIVLERDTEQLEIDLFSPSPPIITKLIFFKAGGQD